MVLSSYFPLVIGRRQINKGGVLASCKKTPAKLLTGILEGSNKHFVFDPLNWRLTTIEIEIKYHPFAAGDGDIITGIGPGMNECRRRWGIIVSIPTIEDYLIRLPFK